MGNKLLYLLLAVAVITTLTFAKFIAPLCLEISGELHHGEAATVDFSSYWAGGRAFFEGKNPYARESVAAHFQALGVEQHKQMITWNPPWFFIVTYPFTRMDFSKGAQLWALFGLTLQLLSVWLAVVSLKLAGSEKILAVALGLTYFPFWETIGWGQSSLLPACGVMLLLFGYLQRTLVTAIAALILMSIKPHSSYLLTFAFLLNLTLFDPFSTKRARTGVIVGATVIVTLLVTYLLSPDSISGWFHSFIDQNGPSSTRWLPTSLGGLLLVNYGRSAAFLIPLISLAVVSHYLVRNRAELLTIYPALAALSVITAPYGWAHDHSLTLITSIGALSVLYRQQPPFWQLAIIALFALQFLTFALVTGGAIRQGYQLWWYPFVPLLIWAYAKQKLPAKLTEL